MMAELRNPKAAKPRIAPLDASGKVGSVPQFTKAEVARHAKREDAWIIVDGKVR
jgi:cytochrome b involved in lipid metabolism